MTEYEHLFILFGEECAEIAQRVSKLLRFGAFEIQPGQPLTNLERLASEIVDLTIIMDFLEDKHGIDLLTIGAQFRRAERRAKVLKYIEYARTLGTIQE